MVEPKVVRKTNMFLVSGRKHWRLFQHQDTTRLAPRKNTFDVDVMCPDLERHGAALQQTQPFDVILQPGELLFVPSESPHQVLNVDDTLAISMNFMDATNAEAVKLAIAPGKGDPGTVTELRQALAEGDFDASMDLDASDRDFLDEFKDGYFNRLVDRHPFFTRQKHRGWGGADMRR